MSNKAVGMVWELNLDPQHMLLLLAMADKADQFGRRIFVSPELLGWLTGYDVRHVKRLRAQLEGTDKDTPDRLRQTPVLKRIGWIKRGRREIPVFDIVFPKELKKVPFDHAVESKLSPFELGSTMAICHGSPTGDDALTMADCHGSKNGNCDNLPSQTGHSAMAATLHDSELGERTGSPDQKALAFIEVGAAKRKTPTPSGSARESRLERCHKAALDVAVLTGDAKSTRRWQQIWDICEKHGALAVWDAALQRLRGRIEAGDPPRNPGAWLNSTLTAMLADERVYVPVGTVEERAEILAEIKASLGISQPGGLLPARGDE